MPQFQAITNLERWTVPAKPDGGLWTLVCAYVDGPALLRIRATDDRWGYAPGREAFCGPDGDPCGLVQSDVCLLQTAPIGALIGKFGGSTGDARDAKPFVVGRDCVVRVPNEGGPLYLTINDTADGMANNVGVAGIVSIERAYAPAAPAPPANTTCTAEPSPSPAHPGKA